MKNQKTSLVLLIATVIFFFSTIAAQAGQWFVCSIQDYGLNYNGVMHVKLTDTDPSPAFVERYFVVPKGDMQNAMLATIMTADSMGKNVKVNLGDTTQNSYILTVFTTSE